jgi:hypothetical protein
MTHRANLSAAILLACCAALGAGETPLTLVGIAPDTGISASDGLTRDGALTVSGLALPGQVVALKAGSTAIGGATADSAGAWSIVLAAPLAAGQHTLTAATGSGLGARTSSLVIRIDTTAPAAPTALVCSPDTGSSASDFITAGDSLAISGKAEAGATVRLRLATAADTVEASATADALGAWTVALPPMAEGAWTVDAVLADAAGNEAAFAALKTLVVDRSAPPAPTFTSLSPDTGVAGDWLTSATAPRVGGAAAEAVAVTLSVDGGQPITASLSNGAWSATLPTQQPGMHELAASAVDRAGNRSAAGLRQLEIRTQAVAPTLAFAGDTGAVGDNLTADATLVFNGTAEPGAAIALTIDGAAAGSATADAAGAWSIDRRQQTLADGARTVVARVTDRAGLSASTSLVVNVDTRGPAAVQDITVRPQGGQPGDPLTSQLPVIVAGGAEPGIEVVVLIDDRALAVFRSSPDGVFEGAVGPLATGSHSLVVHARDAAGNFGPPSPVIAIQVGSPTPFQPGIISVGPVGGYDGEPIDAGDRIRVQASIDPAQPALVRLLSLATQAYVADAMLQMGADQAWYAELPGQPEGRYQVELMNVGAVYTAVVIVGTPPGGGGGGGAGLTPPMILQAFSTNSGPGRAFAGEPIMVDIEAGEQPAGTVVELRLNAQPIPGAPAQPAAGLMRMSLPPLPVGTYVLQAFASLPGATAVGSPEYALHVVAPTDPALSRVSIAASGQNQPSGQPILMTAAVETDDPAAEFVCTIDGQPARFTVDGVSMLRMPVSTRQFTFQIAPLADGIHAIGAILRSAATGVELVRASDVTILVGQAAVPQISLHAVTSLINPGMPIRVGEPLLLLGGLESLLPGGEIGVAIDGVQLGRFVPVILAGNRWEVALPQRTLAAGQHSAEVTYSAPGVVGMSRSAPLVFIVQ